MSHNPEHSIIPTLSHELIAPAIGRNRILSEMVESSLAVAKEAAPATLDFDALVSEGKRIQCRKGMTPEDIQAFSLFHQAATARHPEGQYPLHICYLRGFGVQKDRAAAWEWLERSAKAGYAHAQFDIAACYLRDCPYLEFSFDLVKTNTREVLIPANKPISQTELCKLANEYDLCDIAPSHARDRIQECIGNLVKATQWLQYAAEQGHALAQSCLGSCYYSGQGVSQDYAEAAKWYEKAAEQGDEDAQIYLGGCYGSGKGVHRDYTKAFNWYRKAADQGYREGRLRVARCYQHGVGVEVDLAQAYAWLHLACSQYTGNRAKADLTAMMSPTEIETALGLYEELQAKYPRR